MQNLFPQGAAAAVQRQQQLADAAGGPALEEAQRRLLGLPQMPQMPQPRPLAGGHLGTNGLINGVGLVGGLEAQRGLGLLSRAPLHLPGGHLALTNDGGLVSGAAQAQGHPTNHGGIGNNSDIDALVRHNALLSCLNSNGCPPQQSHPAVTTTNQSVAAVATNLPIGIGAGLAAPASLPTDAIDFKNRLATLSGALGGGRTLQSYQPSQRHDGVVVATNQLAVTANPHDLTNRLVNQLAVGRPIGGGVATDASALQTPPSALGLFRNGAPSAVAATAADTLPLSRATVSALSDGDGPRYPRHHMMVPPLPPKKKAKRKKKPADRPKRPLSAYNLFFRDERTRILESIPAPSGYKKKKKKKSKNGEHRHREGEEMPEDRGEAVVTVKRRAPPHGKIGFENLAKVIGKRWQDLSPAEAAPYKRRAEEEMAAYKRKMEEWLAKQEGEGKGSGEGKEEDEDAEEGDGEPYPPAVKKRRVLDDGVECTVGAFSA